MKVKVEIDKNDCVCGIPLADFPQWYHCFYQGAPNTEQLEDEGAAFLNKCLASGSMSTAFPDEVHDFIKDILWWGYEKEEREGIYELIYLQWQTRKDVADKVRRGVDALHKNGLESCLKILVSICGGRKGGIRGIGVSTATKILRMMLPKVLGVFDKVMEINLSESYQNDKTLGDYEGYTKFCEGCRNVASALNDRAEKSTDFRHPIREGGWRAADVEAALYAYFKWKFAERQARERKI